MFEWIYRTTGQKDVGAAE